MNLKHKLTTHLNDLLLLLLIALLLTLFSQQTESFKQIDQWLNLLNVVSYRLILALGMCFVMATGGIDLSVSALIGFSGIILGLCIQSGIDPFLAILAMIVISSLCGLFNGLVIHYSQINPFIITLTTASIFQGLSLVFTKGIPITRFPKELLVWNTWTLLGLSPTVIVSIFILILALIFGHFTKWGKYIRSIGSNHLALRRTGVNTMFYHVSVYALMGLLASFIGFVLTVKLNSAEIHAGGSLGMDAITAVILGGAHLKGGNFRILGTVLAVLLLGVIRVGLTAISVSSYYQELIIGLVLFIAVLFSNFWNKK